MSKVVHSNELKSFNKTLERYLLYNKKEQGPLIENRANRLRWNIYTQFKAIAPTSAKIDKEVQSLNYAIKRGFNSGKRRTIKQEIRARKRSLRFLSVSWLFREWKRSHKGQNARVNSASRSKKKIGEALLNTGKGKRNPSVLLSSFLEGVQTQNSRKGIISKALKDEVDDMQTYIKRKQIEQFKRLLKS